MSTIKIDYENNADAWWTAAREFANAGHNPSFTRILNALEGSDEVGDDVILGDLGSFVAIASALPGWEDGPRYAQHPVLFA
jgi:hypothetical protein